MQFGKNPSDTTNTSKTFPLTYEYWVTLVAVGFFIGSRGRQSCSVTLSGFSTWSDVSPSGTSNWLSLGV